MCMTINKMEEGMKLARSETWFPDVIIIWLLKRESSQCNLPSIVPLSQACFTISAHWIDVKCSYLQLWRHSPGIGWVSKRGSHDTLVRKKAV